MSGSGDADMSDPEDDASDASDGTDDQSEEQEETDLLKELAEEESPGDAPLPFEYTGRGLAMAVRVVDTWLSRRTDEFPPVAYDRHGAVPDLYERAMRAHKSVPPGAPGTVSFAEALKLQIDRVIPRARAWLGDFASGSKIEQIPMQCLLSPKELLVRHARKLQRKLDAEIQAERAKFWPQGEQGEVYKPITHPHRAGDLAYWKQEINNMRLITRVPHADSLAKWQVAVAKAVAWALFPYAHGATVDNLYGLLNRGCAYGLPGARAGLLSRVDSVDAWELQSRREYHGKVGTTLDDWLMFPPKQTPPLAQLPGHLRSKNRSRYDANSALRALTHGLKLHLADMALIDVYGEDKGTNARLFTEDEIAAIAKSVEDNFDWLKGGLPNGDGSWWDDYLRWLDGFWDGLSEHMRPGALRCAIANANFYEPPKKGEPMDRLYGAPTILQAAVIADAPTRHEDDDDFRDGEYKTVEVDAEREVRGSADASTSVLVSQRARTQRLVDVAVSSFEDDLTTAAYCDALHVQHADDPEGLPRGTPLEGKTVLREVDTDSAFFGHVKSLFAQSDPRMLGQGNDAQEYASALSDPPFQPEEPTVPDNGVADIEFGKTPYGQIVPIKVFEVDMEHRMWQINPSLDAPSRGPTPNPNPQTTNFKAGYDAARAIVESDLQSHMSMWYRKRKFPLAPRSELNPRGVAPAKLSDRSGKPEHWDDPYFVDPEKLERPPEGTFDSGCDRQQGLLHPLLHAAQRLDAKWLSAERKKMIPYDERVHYKLNRSDMCHGGGYDQYGLEYAAVRATVALRTKEERKQVSEWPDDDTLPKISLDGGSAGVHSAVHHTRLGRWWKKGLSEEKLTWTHRAMTPRPMPPADARVDYAQEQTDGGLLHGGPMRYDVTDARATAQLNETMFLHGTASRLVPHILAGGFDAFQKTVEGTYFGSGIYFAEDPAKADQYGRLAGSHKTKALPFDKELANFFGIDVKRDLVDAVKAGRDGDDGQHVFYMVIARATTGLTAMTSHYNFASLNRLGTFMAPEHSYREFVAAEFSESEREKLAVVTTVNSDGSTSVRLKPVGEEGWNIVQGVWERYWNQNYQGGSTNLQSGSVHGEKRNFVERNELLFEEVWQYLEYLRSNDTHGAFGFRPPSRLFRVATWDDEPNVRRRFYESKEGVPRVESGLSDRDELRLVLGNEELAIRSHHATGGLPYLAVATNRAHQNPGSNMNRQEQIHRQYHCLQANGYGGRTMRGTGQRWEHLIRFQGKKRDHNDTYFGGQMRFREFVMFQNRRNTPAAVIPQFLVAYKRLPRPVTDVAAEGPRALVQYDPATANSPNPTIYNNDYTRDYAATESQLITWTTPTVYSLRDPYCPCETWDPSRWRHSLHDYPTIYQQMPYVMGRRTRTDAYTPPLIFDYYGDWLRVLNSVQNPDDERVRTDMNTPGVQEQLQVSDRLYNPDERGPYYPSGMLKRAEDDEDAVMDAPQVLDWPLVYDPD